VDFGGLEGDLIFSTTYVTVSGFQTRDSKISYETTVDTHHTNKHNTCAMSLRERREGGVAHTIQPVLLSQKQKQKTRESKIPQALQFPLVVLLSFTSSSLLSSLVPTFGNESLRRVTKTPDGWELGFLLGWRV